ncbi:MAG: sulfatase-like hydrolase/transferase [Fuerstiella sp.]|nr:sulfatase-like hydrolase/transferase [Fuerstiella sp.]MCP4855776.1 sulfatase-like hydrolase/transferase [Fuerstiella sp.]
MKVPILLSFIFLSSITAGDVSAREATGKPNFLIVVTDDQGYADLSAYEHHAQDVHTPNMDRIAANGILFTEAYVTAPVCSPSRAGWNTGMHQVRWDPKSSFGCGHPESVPNIAEIMKANGYATARFGKNDYGKGMHRQDVREYPLNHGYDAFLGFCAHGHDFFLLSKEIEKQTPDPRGHSAVVGPLMHNKGVKEFKDGYLTEIFTDAAIDFLKQHSSGSRHDFRSKQLSAETRGKFRYQNASPPFFVTLSYNSVHHLIHQAPKRYLDRYGVKEIPNYDPKTDSDYADWFKRFITLGEISDEEMRKYYLANLNCLDDNIGRVLNALDKFTLADNTVVILFSDNGGAPTNGAWNLPLAGSKFTLWEGGIRVPFILSRPGDPHAGETWDQPVSTLDVVPTCLEAAGIEIPEDLDGRLISQTTAGTSEPRNLFWRWGKSYAVRSGDWKLLHNGGKMNRKPTAGIVNRTGLLKGTRLFNVREDVAESQDLASEHPEVTHRLKKLYADWSKEVSGEKRGAK